MAIYNPATEAELRTIIGYWDDSGATRVAGTANTVGDIVNLPAATITASGIDRVLSVKPGVHIIGRGTSSILSGFGFRCIGSGGAAVASAFGNWTLDINGLADTEAGATATFGGAIIEDASIASKNWKITNSTTSDGANNLTIVSTPGVDPIECLLVSPEITSAQLDCLSTKGGGAGGNTSTLIRVFNGSITLPGSGGADQAVTTHEGVPIEIYGGTIAGNAAGSNQAFVTAGDGSEAISKLVNVNVTGQVTRCHTLEGCLIDLDDDHNIIDPRVVRDTRLINSPNVGTADGYAIRYFGDITGWTNDFEVTRVSDEGTTGGTGIFVPTATYTGTATITNYVATDKARGIDLRDGVSNTITDAVLGVSEFCVLNGNPSVTTGTRITTNLGTFNGADPGGITVEDPLLQATIDAQRDLVNVGGASQPSVTADWSSAVLEAFSVIGTSSTLRRGKYRKRNRSRK